MQALDQTADNPAQSLVKVLSTNDEVRVVEEGYSLRAAALPSERLPTLSGGEAR